MTDRVLTNSYYKIDENFVAVDQYEGTLSDEEYVEGAIEMIINGRVILSKVLWDDINDLWPLLCEQVADIEPGEKNEISFPDQPIPYVVVADEKMKNVTVECGHSDIGFKKQSCNYKIYKEAIFDGAEHFWNNYLRIAKDPNEISSAKDDLKRIKNLREKTSHLK